MLTILTNQLSYVSGLFLNEHGELDYTQSKSSRRAMRFSESAAKIFVTLYPSERWYIIEYDDDGQQVR